MTAVVWAVFASVFASVGVLVGRPSGRIPVALRRMRPPDPLGFLDRSGGRAAAVAVPALLMGVATGVVPGAAVAVLAGALARSAAERRRDRRAAAEQAAWLRALQVFQAALRVGDEPGPALREAAKAGADCDVVALRLRRAARYLALGGPAAQAFPVAAGGVERRIGSCLTIAESLGLRPGQVLLAVARTALDAEQERRELRVSLASARATAQLLAVLPLAGVALGSVLDGSVPGFLFGSRTGGAVLLTAALLEAAGLLWATRIGRPSPFAYSEDILHACVLLGAVIEAGCPLPQAVSSIAETSGGWVGLQLRGLLRPRPAASWGTGAEDRYVGQMRDAVEVALRAGAPPVFALGVVADAIRADLAAGRAEHARRASIRVVGPLALCFLPAFVLIAVVPVVAQALLRVAVS